MRQLMHRLRRGLTLIELMAGLAIAAILLGMAAPYLSDTLINGQLRTGGQALLSETLYAQGEAIKRNVNTRITFSAGQIEVRDMGEGEPGVVLRRRQLAQGLSANAEVVVNFNSRGAVMPLGNDGAVDLGKTGVTCSSELRCPGLRIDGGGGVRLCADQLQCG